MKLQTVVLLCGGPTARLRPLLRNTPVCMLPVFNRPLISRNIEYLIGKGFVKIFVCASKDDAGLAECVNELGNAKAHIECIQEANPRGTAGAIGDLKARIGQESFLVLNGNIFLLDVDFADIAADHYKRGSAVTVGVSKGGQGASQERLFVDDDLSITGFSITHSSMPTRFSYTAAGVYVFSPVVFEFIKADEYFDIKEQLIASLVRHALPLRAFEVKGDYCGISTVEDYFNAHKESLLKGSMPLDGMREVADKVYAGDGVLISPNARVVGPVFIGAGTEIADNAQVIGPAVIDNNCVAAGGAVIRESIAWNGVVVEGSAKLTRCIVASGLRVKHLALNGKLIVGRLTNSDVNLAAYGNVFNGAVETSMPAGLGRLRYLLSLGVKRLIDTVASILLLVLLSPLFLLIAVAVKFESAGPVIFRQIRCGKDGQGFKMFKFRSMEKDADAKQQGLKAHNSGDGPVFKLKNDPRVTKVGRFLRKTSLDELPQLVNVLKGEMSLVGPRPLVSEEMKFSQGWRSLRLKVKPGITGMWQVEARRGVSFHEWITNDVYYVNNQSLSLDFKILLKTMRLIRTATGS